MEEKPTPEIVDCDRIRDRLVQNKSAHRHSLGTNERSKSVVKDKAAPPLWARFYEIETMKPIFLGRDSVIRYDVCRIEAERRNGYAWYVSTPNELLEQRLSEMESKI